jgi:hypothetical protein
MKNLSLIALQQQYVILFIWILAVFLRESNVSIAYLSIPSGFAAAALWRAQPAAPRA